MLFNSYQFILGFVPIVVAIYFTLNRFDRRWRLMWLLFASFIFYGWWNPVYVPLLLGSVGVNYAVGSYIATRQSHRRWLLIVGIIFNLGLLGFFKYAGFFTTNLNLIEGVQLAVPTLLLPLAISFYTFQQIAFLVDTYRGFVGRVSFLNYAVFVTFFPQLIAGPIVHHKEVMPQFATRQNLVDFSRLAVALSIFTVGLFKKTVIADGLAPTANLVFAKADSGNLISSIEAFAGTFAYSFQLYFDFSGYSDMAIGLALLFGIRLPVNFRSPYRADSIIEFWRRWHITLSRFLRDYLYIPLGGNRKGATRRATNMMATMLLGGLWHGAGWTFVIWGGLHGALLLVNQVWAGVISRHPGLRMPKFVAVGLTFLTISFFWIFFRAETVDGALIIISGMGNFDAGLMSQNQLALLLGAGVQKVYYTVGLFVLAFIIVFAAPNAANYYLDGKSGFKFNPDLARLIFVIAMWVVIILTIGDSSEFLYFQF